MCVCSIVPRAFAPIARAEPRPPPTGEKQKRRKRFTPHTRHLLELARRRQQAAVLSLRYIGVRYVWGGNGPRGFDCSGLVQYVMSRVGIKVPHYTYSQLNLPVPVPAGARLRAGDAVFFHGGSHMGLVLDQTHYIASPHTGAYVRIRELPPRRDLYAVRRFIT